MSSPLTRIRLTKMVSPSSSLLSSRTMTTISRSRFNHPSSLTKSLQSRSSLSTSRSFINLSPSTSNYNFNRNMARYMHVRTISFSSVPKAAFRAFRVPAYAMTAAGGAFAYANYKVDEFRGFVGEAFSRASNSASDAFGTLSNNASQAMDSARAQWEAASENLSNIETPEFLQSLWKRIEEGRDELSSKINQIGESTKNPTSVNHTSSSSRGGGEEEGGGGGNGNGLGGAALAAALAGNVTDSNGQERKPIDSSEELMVLTRKLIEVRNILKSIDKESDSHSLTLPSIVVIGSQSSGKSSVLEAIVGHEFLPKGNNMVTRRPIELTLIHTESTSNNRKGEVVEFAEFPGMGIGRMTDFKQVQKTLYDLNMAVPAEECVSEVPIELKIHSPHVPDLTLIDLPGYVQIAGMDQPEELREKISDLCEKYIAEPNIILAVCSADVDLANSPALRASRKVDPLGLRTIGVVTKMDLVEPQIGNNILMNNKYPLALGYIGVVCKNKLGMFSNDKGHDSSSGEGNLSSSVMKQENDYFSANREHFRAPARGVNAGVEPLVGTDTLRRRLMSVLEESMGSSLHGIANAVQVELEEAGYQFKVQYNDRSITAESYVAETMDALKLRFSEFANSFGKPQVRQLLKQSLDEKVLDIMAQLYWSDERVKELTKLAEDKKISDEDVDRYWKYKLDVSTSSLTKSGIGRLSTQIVVDEIRKQIENLAKTEPFNHHPEASDRIIGFSTAILRDRFGLTSDQVENCVKPFKYEVEVEPTEWENSRQKSLVLLERELKMCNEAFDQINKIVGKKRLNNAIGYVNSLEEREKRKSLERQKLRESSNVTGDSSLENSSNQVVEEDPTLPDYNSALLSKARDAKFLLARSEILKLRAQTLKSKRCKFGPESKAFCPETFLNVVSDKLTYTAVMFINIELLSEFFYQFPREIDSRLVYDLDKNELSRFARENPAIKKHLDLQERKEKLEMVMEKLDSLVKLYNEKQSPRRNQSSNKWGFF